METRLDLFEEVEEINNTVCIVKSHGKYGIYDTWGEVFLSRPVYSNIRYLGNDLFELELEGKFGVKDPYDEDFVLPVNYEKVTINGKVHYKSLDNGELVLLNN